MKASKYNRSEIFKTAYQFVKKYGVSFSEALRTSWRNAKLKVAMAAGIVKFYFQKVDGSIREAYGTLMQSRLPETKKDSGRKQNDSVQVYFDTEKEEWRCFKKINLINIVAA